MSLTIIRAVSFDCSTCAVQCCKTSKKVIHFSYKMYRPISEFPGKNHGFSGG